MDDDLTQRLLLAETDFLDALQSGPQMLASYSQTLSALLNLLSVAQKSGNVGTETLSLANSVASRISKIASCFLDIRHAENHCTTQLQSDYEAMFPSMAGLNLSSDNTSGSPCPSACPTKPTPDPECASPPFLTSAYRWLLDNLHNPYPTAKVKNQIAAASSCQVSSVNSWFINARRRIGWTTLCRERFSNCRADMINAAYRALVQEDPQHTLSPDLRHSFVAMKVAAEDLYPSTFTRSAFVGDLDAVVKDIANVYKESVEAGECRQVEQANLRKTVRDSYPSPDRSITSSPVPALDNSTSEGEEDVVPLSTAGSKRRWSSIEPVDQMSSTARRPIKRLRASTTSPTYLPSPPSSTDDISSDDGSPESFVVSAVQPNGGLPSRERRPSDANSIGISKCPCGSMVSTHPVSDPLPRINTENECSIDDWFHTNFDALFTIPPPVEATEPDFSTSWQVELFSDYSIPGNPKYPPAPAADTNVSAMTNISDLDNLLQAIGDDTFTNPSESVPLFGAAGAPYMGSLDPSVPDLAQTNLDWTSLLGPDTFQSTIHSTFPQYPTDTQPPPNIDLSMLQLPHVMPPVDSQSDFESKQAKLQQFHAMQEAVRRMERELQSEGVII